ncbi:MAG: hypothetical protein EBY28_00700 [Betaproteobacteria bacterium]|nr:hypothetical protein [Betaproteobacteria bacterium]
MASLTSKPGATAGSSTPDTTAAGLFAEALKLQMRDADAAEAASAPQMPVKKRQILPPIDAAQAATLAAMALPAALPVVPTAVAPTATAGNADQPAIELAGMVTPAEVFATATPTAPGFIEPVQPSLPAEAEPATRPTAATTQASSRQPGLLVAADELVARPLSAGQALPAGAQADREAAVFQQSLPATATLSASLWTPAPIAAMSSAAAEVEPVSPALQAVLVSAPAIDSMSAASSEPAPVTVESVVTSLATAQTATVATPATPTLTPQAVATMPQAVATMPQPSIATPAVTATPQTSVTPQAVATTQQPNLTTQVVATTARLSMTPQAAAAAPQPKPGVTTQAAATTPQAGVTTQAAATTPQASVTTQAAATTPQAGVTPQVAATTPQASVTPQAAATTPQASVTAQAAATTPQASVTAQVAVTTLQAVAPSPQAVATPSASTLAALASATQAARPVDSADAGAARPAVPLQDTTWLGQPLTLSQVEQVATAARTVSAVARPAARPTTMVEALQVRAEPAGISAVVARAVEAVPAAEKLMTSFSRPETQLKALDRDQPIDTTQFLASQPGASNFAAAPTEPSAVIGRSPELAAEPARAIVDSGRLQLQMQSAELGPMSLDMALDAAGHAHLIVHAATESLALSLGERTGQLVDAMRDMGLTVQVDVRQGGSQAGFTGGGAAGQQASPDANRAGAAPPEPRALPIIPATPRRPAAPASGALSFYA